MKSLEDRYNELDDMMKMYFRERTLIESWNKSAETKNKLAREFNESKHWWQKRKPDNFPSYYTTPVRMPSFFPVPPVWHPQYQQTKELIEDYLEEMA